MTIEQIQEEDIKIEGSLRPRYLCDYIGQDKVKDTLKIYIDAARERGDSLDHVLFYGPPGLGKTTLAAIIAAEMGVNFRVTSGPAIEKQGDLAALLTNLQPGDVLFIDEIHRLQRSVEEILYPAMEDHVLDIIIGKGPTARSIRLDLPAFTLIGVMDVKRKLPEKLLSCFSICASLTDYSTHELIQLAQKWCAMQSTEITGSALEKIALYDKENIANGIIK